MRLPILLSSLTLLRAILASSDGYSPYTNPLLDLLSDEAQLVKRQSCRSGYNSCSNLGAAQACCPSNTNCAFDQAGHVACCPFNAVCTGTIAGTILGSATGSVTSSSGFVLGATTTTATTSFQSAALPTSGVQGGGSTVPNQYYPFIYIPTSYANAALCSSAYTNCQAQSTACFSSLAGSNGVTVTGFGGGVTVQGSSGTVLSAASRICSSLSQNACYGIQATVCNQFGGATGTNTGTGVVQAGAGPRQTACPGMVYAAGAGAMVGAMGVLL